MRCFFEKANAPLAGVKPSMRDRGLEDYALRLTKASD